MFNGMQYEDLVSMRSEIIREKGRVEMALETARIYGMDDPAGYLEDAVKAFDDEIRKINEAIGKLIDKETEAWANDLLFFRP